MILASVGTTLAPFAAANAKSFNDDADELLSFMKLQTRADDGYTNYLNAGTVYAAVPGRAPVPLYGYEGLLRFHTRVMNKSAYEVAFIEAGTYLDLKTGDRLDRFPNPLTGITNTVDHIVEGPMSWQWTTETVHVTNPLPILRRRVDWQHFNGQSWLHFDNFISLTSPAGSPIHAAALATYVGSTAQMRDMARNSVSDTMLIDSSINPLAPWLEMGSAPGRLANNIIGRKLGTLSEAPDRLIKYISAAHPKVLNGAEAWKAAS